MTNRELLKKISDYLSAKESPTEQETELLQGIGSELKHFIIATVSRETLAQSGFDILDVDDNTMEKLADGMADEYCDDQYNSSLNATARGLGVSIEENMFCPKCEKKNITFNKDEEKYECDSCGQQWGDVYVLLQSPEDASYFSNDGIGYPCGNSEDIQAMYISEYSYIEQFGKSPAEDSYYQPVQFPDSQKFLEEPVDERCEFINDEGGLEAFGMQSVWVPLDLLTKHNSNNG